MAGPVPTSREDPRTPVSPWEDPSLPRGSTHGGTRPDIAPPPRGRSVPPFGALLGACRRALRQAHRLLRVDLEVGVLARAGGRRVEVAAERLDRVRLPQAHGFRVILGG